MENNDFTAGATPPPDFDNARTRHQKARSAGMHPDYWYPVESNGALKAGAVTEVVFWKRSIALFRGQDGEVRAIDNQCAHRRLALTEGKVVGCHLACLYHGWEHAGDGTVAHIPHELFGRQIPKARLRSYPVQVRYGLIWIFPGDPALAQVRTIPEVPELMGANPWHCVPFTTTWQGHHSMIIDNVSDFTHAYLHRRYKPFTRSTLTGLESRVDAVHVSYRTQVGASRAAQAFLNPQVDRGSIHLCYQYPYQWSDTGGKIKHWCFLLPIDERTTRCFFLFLFAPDLYRVPFLRVRLPGPLVRFVLVAVRKAYIGPLLDQDRVAIEAEQRAHQQHHGTPIPELNPAVTEFQRLTISKWADHVGASTTPTTAEPTTRHGHAPISETAPSP